MEKPKKVVIAFAADGTIHHTYRPDFFDPFADSVRHIERMTDIKWSDEEQKFYIVFLVGILRNLVLSTTLLDYIDHGAPLGEVQKYDSGVYISKNGEIVYFATYDDAVREELRVVDLLRKKGIRFHD